MNTSITDEIKSIQFTDINNGYCSCLPFNNLGYIIKTTNKGSNWFVLQNSVGFNLWNVCFINPNTGFASGLGTIIKTTDGGSDWSELNSRTMNNLLSMFFINENTGYAAGDWGTILKTNDAGGSPIGIKEPDKNIPKDFILYQNYPNPFNPVTEIKFSIAPHLNLPLSGGDVNALAGTVGVKLIVFDELGREVAALVNEQLQSGTYEINFDGTKLASGIYFYRLETASFTDTKKMVLLK